MFKKLFIPSEDSDLTSLMLLVLRLWFGLTMLFNHGIGKLAHFSEVVQTFPIRWALDRKPAWCWW